MKTLLLLLFPLMLFGQVNTVVTTPELEDISSMEQTLVHYAKQIIEGSKYVGEESIKLIDKGVNTIITEGTAIVSQYIMYKAIYHGIPVLIGIYLLFFLSRKLFKMFIIDKQEAEAFNDYIKDAEEEADAWKKASLQNINIKILGYYFSTINHFLFSLVGSLLAISTGIYLLLFNLMIFIKVTLFPKLYIAELLMQYLKINI